MDPSLSAVGVTDTMVSASCQVIYFTHKYWDLLSLEERSNSVQKFWAARILGRSVNWPGYLLINCSSIYFSFTFWIIFHLSPGFKKFSYLCLLFTLPKGVSTKWSKNQFLLGPFLPLCEPLSLTVQ